MGKPDYSALLDLQAIRAEKARRSLREFIAQSWSILEPQTAYRPNWHIDAICDHLEAITRGDIKKLNINIPSGCMKSLTVCVFWPAWEWITFPHKRWLFASYASHLSSRDGIKFGQLVGSQWYRNLYGDRYGIKKFTESYISNTKTGFRISTSVGGVGTGERVHISVNDDLLRANDAQSKAMKQQAVDHMEAMASRGVDPATYAQVIIMQRLADDDPTAWAMDHGFESLILPMEFEPDRMAATSIGFRDPRTEAGELLWPSHFDAETVESIKQSLGTYGAAAQLQQRPSPLGGGIIKGRHFGRYDILPKMKYRKIYADTAQKTGERHDYSVFECWGLGEDNKIYLIDMLRGKWEAFDLKRNAIDFWNRCRADAAKPANGAVRKMAVEDKASGTGLIQDIKREGKIPIEAIQRSKDKLTRVMDVVSYIESGYVMIPSDADFVSAFIAECEAFTADDSHRNDDQIDPLCDAISDMLATGGKRGFFS